MIIITGHLSNQRHSSIRSDESSSMITEIMGKSYYVHDPQLYAIVQFNVLRLGLKVDTDKTGSTIKNDLE